MEIQLCIEQSLKELFKSKYNLLKLSFLKKRQRLNFTQQSDKVTFEIQKPQTKFYINVLRYDTTKV